jgi:hypothetical protein
MWGYLVDVATGAVLRLGSESRVAFWGWAVLALARGLLWPGAVTEAVACLCVATAALLPVSPALYGALLGAAGSLSPAWLLCLACAALPRHWRSALSFAGVVGASGRAGEAAAMLLGPRAALTPSLGLRWYFFAELFWPFAPLYAVLWAVLVAAPLLALSHSLHRASASPLLATACCMVVAAVFSPLVSPATVALAGALALSSPGCPPLARCALLLPAAAQPLYLATTHLWTVAGSGNANFVYAATLVSAAAHMYVLSELGAAGQRSWQL